MAVGKKFLKKAIDNVLVREYLEKSLRKAGISQIIVQKTPIATRVTMYVRRPGIVVGRGGSGIKELSEVLQKKFGVENPQIEVIEVENPALDANLVAERIAKQIEVTGRAKQVMRSALREVMESGAIGAEIRVAGKIVGKGGKARVLTARAGYLKKSGDIMKLVRKGRYVAHLRAGAIGVKVKIVPPGTVFPDKTVVPEIKEPVAEASAPEQTAEAASVGEGVGGEQEEKSEETK